MHNSTQPIPPISSDNLKVPEKNPISQSTTPEIFSAPTPDIDKLEASILQVQEQLGAQITKTNSKIEETAQAVTNALMAYQKTLGEKLKHFFENAGEDESPISALYQTAKTYWFMNKDYVAVERSKLESLGSNYALIRKQDVHTLSLELIEETKGLMKDVSKFLNTDFHEQAQEIAKALEEKLKEPLALMNQLNQTYLDQSALLNNTMLQAQQQDPRVTAAQEILAVFRLPSSKATDAEIVDFFKDNRDTFKQFQRIFKKTSNNKTQDLSAQSSC